MDQKKKKAGYSAYAATIVIIFVTYALASAFLIYILKDASAVPVFIVFSVMFTITITFYALLPIKLKNGARYFSLWFMGALLMVLAGILGRQNLQLEGVFFALFTGIIGGALVHYMLAKIVGPLLWGRSFCGWGCWTTMVLDLLPYKKAVPWRRSSLRKMRYLHFFLSFGVVASLVFGLHYMIDSTSTDKAQNYIERVHAAYWMLGGNVLYYLLGIVLAVKMKDNRAFCKYLCPAMVMAKVTTIFSLLRIKGNKAACDNCGTCSSFCIKGIDVPAYITNGERVKSTECVMCMKCVAHCPQAALKSSVGLDMVKEDRLLTK